MAHFRFLWVWSLVAVLAACSTDNSNSDPTPETYRDPGPWDAGVTTLTLADRGVEVWYPVEPEDTEGLETSPYFIRDFLSARPRGLTGRRGGAPRAGIQSSFRNRCVPRCGRERRRAVSVGLVLARLPGVSNAVDLPHDPFGELGVRGRVRRPPRMGSSRLLGHAARSPDG